MQLDGAQRPRGLYAGPRRVPCMVRGSAPCGLVSTRGCRQAITMEPSSKEGTKHLSPSPPPRPPPLPLRPHHRLPQGLHLHRRVHFPVTRMSECRSSFCATCSPAVHATSALPWVLLPALPVALLKLGDDDATETYPALAAPTRQQAFDVVEELRLGCRRSQPRVRRTLRHPATPSPANLRRVRQPIPLVTAHRHRYSVNER